MLAVAYYLATIVLITNNSSTGINEEIKVYIQITYSLIVVLMFVKFCFFMRIFPGFGFLVSMLKEVVIDLKYFIAFFFIVMFTFALIFMILDEDL